MRRLSLLIMLLLSLACLDVSFQGGLTSRAQMTPRNTGQDTGPVELNPSPPVQRDTMPLRERQTTSSLSPDSPVSNQDYMIYSPYNTYPRELDLWNLEARKFIRSDAVVSPNKDFFAYTEIMHMPHTRQTMARLYLVPIPPPPQPQMERLPSEEAASPPPVAPDPSVYAARFDPDKTLKLRQTLVGVGYDRVNPYEFRTLTIVDWSATGQKLLFKQRSGVQHIGLRTSDILVYDQGRGAITIYPEVQRVIKHYWLNQGNLPNMDRLAWDIQPLGWVPGSDSLVLLKAWAYDRTEKKFLGVWSYDVDGERTRLQSLENTTVPVAANGYLAEPMPITKEQRKEMLKQAEARQKARRKMESEKGSI